MKTPALIRGTHDLLPDDMHNHLHISNTALALAMKAGYGQIATPIIEPLEVFKRTLGETSDVVSKEMYVFEDRKGQPICLRPENTASVMRAFINAGMAQNTPQRYFYSGPMFRYERPQSGRQRQFHQIGIEAVGVDNPMGDVEVMSVGDSILKSLGLQDITLEINSLGDQETRLNYRQKLIDYFSKYQNDLSADSQTRLHINPLRLLDSKDPNDRKIIQDAPKLIQHLNDYSKGFFDRVCNGLSALGISWTLNENLVRGLDYYCHTAFEFTSPHLGAQATVMAGGRYDGLVKMMGGPDISGVGWAAGIERLAMLMALPPARLRPIAVIALGEIAQESSLKIWQLLQAHNHSAILISTQQLKKGLKQAHRANASFAILLGEEEINAGHAILRNLDEGQQTEVSFDQIINFLDE